MYCTAQCSVGLIILIRYWSFKNRNTSACYRIYIALAFAGAEESFVVPQPKAKKVKGKATMQHVSKTAKMSVANAWIMGTTENGHTYYYNTTTGGQLLFKSIALI